MEIKIVKTKNDCEKKLTAVVEGEEWADALKHALGDLAKNVTVKGFRKGMAPLAQASKVIPHSEVLNKAADKAVAKAYDEMIKGNKVRPILRPELVVNAFDDNKFDFSFIIVTAPEVKLGEYKGLTIAKDEVVVSDEDVENELNSMAKKDAEMVVVEEGVAAELGNTTVIDFVGYVDGKPFEGGESANYELKLGSNTFVPGFEDQLVGVKKGDTKDVVINFPENYVAELAGKEATFKVTVNEIKKEVIPAIDDEFAKDCDIEGVDTLDQLKEHVKADLLARKERAAADKQVNDLLQTVIDNSTLKINAKLIEDDANSIVEDFKKRVEQQGYDLDDFCKITNTSKEKLQEQAREEALKREKKVCVMAKLSVEEKLDVTKDEVQARINELAKQYNMKPEDFSKQIGNRINDFAANMRDEKVMKFLKENNTL